MLLYPPERFDHNEWTIIISLIFNIAIFVFLPKRIPNEITPLIVLLSISIPQILDHTIAVKPFNLYDLVDSSKYEIFDVIAYGVFPAFGYLFVYILDYFKFKSVKLVAYFVGWSLFALVVEYVFVKLEVFVYTGWKLIYSLPFYIISLIVTFLFYQLLIKHKEFED